MCFAADRLEALSSSIGGCVADSNAAQLVLGACILIGTCARICGEAAVPEPLPGFLPCAQLVQRCGAAAQQFSCRRLQREYSEVFVGQLGNAIAVRVRALDLWQQACSLSPSPDPATVTQECAPPELLHSWLQQTLTSLQLLDPSSWRPGGE